MNSQLDASIDGARRQQLLFKLLGTILDNQLNGAPDGDLLKKQQILLAQAGAEVEHLQLDLNELVARREAPLATKIQVSGI